MYFNTIREESLQQSVVRAINMVIGDKVSFISILQQNIATALDERNTEAIDTKLGALQKELRVTVCKGKAMMEFKSGAEVVEEI